jgi:hypothetical protein
MSIMTAVLSKLLFRMAAPNLSTHIPRMLQGVMIYASRRTGIRLSGHLLLVSTRQH